MGFIRDCYQVMQIAHKGQFRTSGEPYEQHPIAVAHVYHLVWPHDYLGFGGCLLHDGIETSSITLKELAGFLKP